MNEINVGMGLVPETANLLRGVNAIKGIRETPGLPFETLQEKMHQVMEANDTAKAIGFALLIEVADQISHLPPLTGNLIFRLSVKEEN